MTSLLSATPPLLRYATNKCPPDPIGEPQRQSSICPAVLCPAPAVAHGAQALPHARAVIAAALCPSFLPAPSPLRSHTSRLQLLNSEASVEAAVGARTNVRHPFVATC